MRNLLLFHFCNFIVIMELVSLLFSFLTLSSRNEKTLRLFIPTFLCICIAELLGSLWLFYVSKNNAPVYNILDIVVTCLYMLIVYKYLAFSRFRAAVWYMMWGFLVFSVANLLFLQGISDLATFTTILGALAILATVVFAFIEISNLPYQIYLRREPFFWICCAMLVYFLPTALVTAAYEYFSKTQQSARQYAEAFNLSQKIFSTIHYGLLSYSFVCRLIIPV